MRDWPFAQPMLGVARVAAIQGAKRCADLVPLCHPLPLTRVAVAFELEADGVRCEAEVATEGRTGVEMEALCAVQVGLLTIYDMCKALNKHMRIGGIQVVEKIGGKRDFTLEEK